MSDIDAFSTSLTASASLTSWNKEATSMTSPASSPSSEFSRSSNITSSTVADARDTPDTEVDADIISPLAHELLGSSQPSAAAAPSPPESSPSYDKFTLFSKLPLELRFLVWYFAINQPRVTGVLCAWEEDQLDMTGWEHRQTTKRASFIRSVCQEAREEALNFELPLITHLPWIIRPTIFTNATADTVLFLEQDFACELGLFQMLSDLAGECTPAPEMPTIAMHFKWRSFFFGQGLEDLEENLDTLKCFGTKELIFVVGDEEGSRAADVELGVASPAKDPENILEADLVLKVKDELKMENEKKLTWENLEKFDLIRVCYAKEMCESDPNWTVTKITYREVALRA